MTYSFTISKDKNLVIKVTEEYLGYGNTPEIDIKTITIPNEKIRDLKKFLKTSKNSY